jgi:hypothetical protein
VWGDIVKDFDARDAKFLQKQPNCGRVMTVGRDTGRDCLIQWSLV